MASSITNVGPTTQLINAGGLTQISQTSYKSVYALRNMFRSSGGHYDSFNNTELPGTFFFRLFFYFDNKCYANGDGINASNFLSTDVDSPTINGKEPYNNKTIQDHKFANSALNYLLINNEYERAEMLLQFISLLANINTYSPWYFSEITGLAEAVERKEFTEDSFKVEDNRRAISIKCLPDSVDTRIGTLLDMYREICYSYTLKKEIVPANLRKFDIGLYIFNSPLFGIDRFKQIDEESTTENYAEMDLAWRNTNYRTSSKYLEFHNCEIDPNSTKSAFDTINNTEGKQNEYNINIWYDSCYERRYNEFIMREIGDYVYSDIVQGAQKDQIIAHLQGDIQLGSSSTSEGGGGVNITVNESTKKSQTTHQTQLDNRVEWVKNNPNKRLIHPGLVEYGYNQFKTKQGNELIDSNSDNIYYDDPTDNPGYKYNRNNWIQQNVEGAVRGVLSPLNEKVSSIMLGNIYTDSGISEYLDQAERAIKNAASGATIKSKIESLF